MDLSEKAVEIGMDRAREAKVNVDWLHGTVFDLPIKSRSVDVVTDRGLFHAVEDADRPKYSSEVFCVLKQRGHVLIRGASEEVGRQRFNPVTEEAVDKFFPKPKWRRGPVVSIPLYSSAGAIDARIVLLTKQPERG